MREKNERPICDYEGSAYRTEFWGEGREYEDAAERAALRRMLPPTGQRLIDIGGGYGRLVPLYGGYDEVVIFDYALSQLRQAQALWGEGGAAAQPRIRYVAGDFYHLPFAAGAFDTVTMVRTLHHAADAPSVLRGTAGILAPHGTLVLEFANKRNL
ncbi:MAG: class I SAM-dependent methyltransferase, partial [Chloroflexota bacterium]